jgi:pyruvate/2-oxoglutarate dehydrogenase complex dihydrolipoamide dehydrogenase (E3) component
MFNAAHLAHSRKLMHGYGFIGQDPSIAAAGLDFSVLKRKRDAYVSWLNKGYRDDLVDTKIDILDGHATFTGPRQVKIGSTGQVVEV